MDYYYSQKFHEYVILYVEEINNEGNYIIIDFIDSDQHRKFTALFDFDSPASGSLSIK